MTAQTARDAVGRAIFVSAWSGTSIPRDERGHAWDHLMSDGLRSPWTSQADAVLAELGIPADTDSRRIEAGLAIIDYIDAGAPGSLDAVFASPNGWTGRQVVNLAWSTRESEDVVNRRIPTRREASDA